LSDLTQARSPARYLQQQFDDAAQQLDAARMGMWVFLVTEVLFFGGMFAGYTVYRVMYPEAFAAGSAHLDYALGTANTAILLLSSLTMAFAVHAAQSSRRRALIVYLVCTMALGAAFLGIKFSEYAAKFHEHLVPGPGFAWHGPHAQQVEIFVSFYFVMTGMHAMHMIIGLGIMTTLLVLALRGRLIDHPTPVEISGLYWHFVDIVWIIIFTLVYLLE